MTQRFGHGLLTSAVSLMTATAATSGLGLAFWIVAARLFPPSEVGRASATISAAMLVMVLAQLHLPAVFARFLALAGDYATSFLARGYAATTALVTLIATGFALSPVTADYLHRGASSVLLFIYLAVVLHLAALQDAVITALRHAPWVLAGNLATAVAKVTLLAALGLSAGNGLIVMAWLLPATASVLTFGWLLVRRLVPAFLAATTTGNTLPARPQLQRFVFAEYTKSLLTNVPSWGLPLCVVAVLGTQQNAYFTLPWLANGALLTMLWNTSVVFVVDSVAGRSVEVAKLRHFLILLALIVGGGSLTMLFFGGTLLSFQGADYAVAGTSLFRWLALALPFSAITTFFSTFLWLERRLWRLVLLQSVSLAVLTVVGIPLLLHIGIAGIGMAHALAQLVVGLSVLRPCWRRIEHIRRRGSMLVDSEDPQDQLADR